MRCCAAPLLLLALAAGCGRGDGAASADSAAPADTAAIRAAESAPHPTPAAADSMADSARRRQP